MLAAAHFRPQPLRKQVRGAAGRSLQGTTQAAASGTRKAIIMKVSVVSLPEVPERRNRIAGELANCSIPWTIHDALHWRNLTDDHWRQYDHPVRLGRMGRRPIPPGSIANSISQRALLATLRDGSDAFLIVLEDDVTISPDFAQCVRALEHSDVPFDIVFLCRNNLRRRYTPAHSVGEKWTLGRVRYSDWGTQGYMISRSAAQRFLDHFPKIVYRMDHSLWAYWEHGLNIFSLNPPVVFRSDNMPSQIGSSVTHPGANFGSIMRGLPGRMWTGAQELAQKCRAYQRLIRSDRRHADASRTCSTGPRPSTPSGLRQSARQ